MNNQNFNLNQLLVNGLLNAANQQPTGQSGHYRGRGFRGGRGGFRGRGRGYYNHGYNGKVVEVNFYAKKGLFNGHLVQRLTSKNLPFFLLITTTQSTICSIATTKS